MPNKEEEMEPLFLPLLSKRRKQGEPSDTGTGSDQKMRRKKNMCAKCKAIGVEKRGAYKDGQGRHACSKHARQDGTFVAQKDSRLCAKCQETGV